MDETWEEVESLLTSTEGPKLDFKWDYDLSTGPGKAEFAKDIAAIANTEGGLGRIIIGVAEKDIPERYGIRSTPSFYERSQDETQRLMVQIISNYIEPPVPIEYREIRRPDTGQRLGIVKVLPSTQRPHFIARGGKELKRTKSWSVVALKL